MSIRPQRAALTLALTWTVLLLGWLRPVSDSTAGGFAPASERAAAPVAAHGRGQPLRVAISTDERALTPWNYNTGYPGLALLSFVYDAVTAFDEQGRVRPWLAEGYPATTDGRVFTFRLREGVRFHDGQPLTGVDVKFSYEALRDNRGGLTTNARNIESVEANGNDVTVTLRRPDPDFPYLQTFLPIVPRHLWEVTTDFRGATYTVGSGPYRLDEVRPGEFYRLVANMDYFRGPPTVEEIAVVTIKEVNTQVAALRAAQIDLMATRLPSELVAPFERDPAFRLSRGPGYATNIILMYNQRPALVRREVRQAIAYAVDTRALVDTLLLGTATLGNPGWFHPASPVHDPDVRPRARDLERANLLLDRLGYRRGPDGIRIAEGGPMEFSIIAYANNPERVRGAELVADALAEIGLRLSVRALEMGAADDLIAGPDFDRTNGQNYDFAMFGWSAGLQQVPSRAVQLFHSKPDRGPFNLSAYESTEMDALFDRLAVTLDPDERLRLLRQVERLVEEDVPFITWAYPDGIFAYRPAAYDGYMFVNGIGPLHPLSFLPRQSN